MSDPRRHIPGTDALLAESRLAQAVRTLGRPLVKAAIADAQGRARSGEITPEEVADAAALRLPARAGSLRPVINATGVLVHTNLGRAPLSAAARDAVAAAAGCTDVEYDLPTGRRARRGRGALAALAEAVPDAEAVHVVNNNAAALFLAALALAPGKEIVISRGELVEIGDGFRIPDLLAATGARLREVGTTNRTTARDYADAVGPATGLLLRIHPSNFRVTGFTAAATVRELMAVGPPVVVDIGSGLLTPHPLLPEEPDAATTLRDGAALVTASGDKLLGGPQAGLLLGAARLVERLRRHPAARAMRVDKLTLAALEATLRGPEPPVRTALGAGEAGLRERATRLAESLRAQGVPAAVVPAAAAVGGGGAPGVTLRSCAVALPAGYGRTLRTGAVPVVGRLERGRCLLDLRTVDAADDAAVLRAVLQAAPGTVEPSTPGSVSAPETVARSRAVATSAPGEPDSSGAVTEPPPALPGSPPGTRRADGPRAYEGSASLGAEEDSASVGRDGVAPSTGTPDGRAARPGRGGTPAPADGGPPCT